MHEGPVSYTHLDVYKRQGLLCDIMHTEGAEVLARYREDFYAGTPVITRNRYGDGLAYYVGTRSGEEFYLRLFTDVCKEKGMRTASHDTVETAAALSEKGIEMTVRKKDLSLIHI